MHKPAPSAVKQNAEPVAIVTKVAAGTPADATGATKAEARAKSTAKPDAKPAAKPAKAAAEAAPGKKPEVLSAARESGPDDLKMIKGVGPKLEQLLHSMGFYHFDQIAKWTEEEISWVDQNLEGFKGRVSRDNWVEQAKLLADGKETEFSARAKKGGVY